MNKRIIKVRKLFGLTQEEFGNKVGGLSRNYIWMLEKGERTPSERTILDICREFNVNPHWLRTGEGEMFREKSAKEELASYFGTLLADEPDIRHRFITVLSKLSIDELKMVEKVALELAEEAKKADPNKGSAV